MVIDLTTLPLPTIIEPLSYEETFARKLANFELKNPDYEFLTEADPAVLALEAAAVDELDLISRTNESYRQLFVAFATGTNLDNLAATNGLERIVLVAEDTTSNPPVAEVLESDDDFRDRIILARQALSVAGPEEYYEAIAKAAGGEDVEDIKIIRPIRGTVRAVVLAANDTGVPSDELLTTIDDALQPRDVRVFNDIVDVVAATAVNLTVNATVKLRDDASQSVFDNLEDYFNEQFLLHRGLGVDITRSWIIGTLQQSGVYEVSLTSPSSNLTIADTAFAKLISLTITQGDSDN